MFACSLFKRRADKNTPKTGIIKLKTVTFDTGLCAKSTPHNEYATADKRARYKSTQMDCTLEISTAPPNITPARTMKIPPAIN